MQQPPATFLSMITFSAPVSFANPSPQVLEGGIRSSTRSFCCSPRSRLLLLELSCCLRPTVVTFAVTARSPRGHGGCSSRAPFLAGVLASTRPTAECAARDQTRSIADFGPIHALTRAFRPRGSALSAISFEPGDLFGGISASSSARARWRRARGLAGRRRGVGTRRARRCVSSAGRDRGPRSDVFVCLGQV